MKQTGLRAVVCAALVSVSLLAGCTGDGVPVSTQTAEIFFETQQVPAAGAGQFYNEVISFGTAGGAAPPDRFELNAGVLPPGVALINDRGLDVQGNPDPEGALTGDARLIGFPREQGSFDFTVKAISTGALGNLAQLGDQPDLTATLDFTLNVGEGAIAFITPTAAEGTADPAVPAFPIVIDFVNPANPQAFFSFPFLAAGGSGQNILNLYMPRELALSVFDANVINGIDTLATDTDETAGSGNKFENDFSDGGWFVLQAGNSKVQVGGFQSPRGAVGAITALDPAWFQRTPGSSGPAINSRRTIGDNQPGGDATLGTPLPVNFSDYFDPRYEGTHPGFTAPPGQPDLTRRKYPFTAAEYTNAFFLSFTDGVDITPLRYRMIAEGIDTRGTLDTNADDVVTRKAYIAQIKIPDIVFDSVVLPPGTAGLDYVVFFNGSGGVPPLSFDIEAVDGTLDLAINAGDPLTQADFQVDVDVNTGQTFGIPTAFGVVEIHGRIFAAVMNPTQGGAAFISTTPGEGAGTHPVTGLAGSHKTFQVTIDPANAPTLGNLSFNEGIDGQPYPTDRMFGDGGVPNLVPAPVDFVGTYPSAQAARTYAFSASYIRDASHGADAGTVDPVRPLPESLELDGDAFSPTNGQITGTANDRGFHPMTISVIDFLRGPASAPSLAVNRQTHIASRALSISPDTTVYLRGVQTAGGEKTGLLSPTTQIAEARMVPLMLSAGLFTNETGKGAVLFDKIPSTIDLVPLIIPNGGSDNNVDKAQPSVGGFWPGEAGREGDWHFFQDRAWKHSQQEANWIESPREGVRVFLWTQSVLATFSASGTWTQRYQRYLTTGERGALVLNPTSGNFFIPAVLKNNNSDGHGRQFGTEMVNGGASLSATGIGYYDKPTYTKFYYYTNRSSRAPRSALLDGLGAYIEGLSSARNTSNGWYNNSPGRVTTSMVMSHNGKWCATAMPGGTVQKVLLFKTDETAIPASMLAKSYIDGVKGFHADGSDFDDAACVISLGGETASGNLISTGQGNIFADSLMFVKGGLLFLNDNNLDEVFGVSLEDGTLTSKSLNGNGTNRLQVNGAGFGGTVFSNDGQLAPDRDYLRAFPSQSFGAQHAWTGNKPGTLDDGPDKIAFAGGDLLFEGVLSDLATHTNDGRIQSVVHNRFRSVFFMDLAQTPGGGLDLAASTLRDLTGSDSDMRGGILSPGTFGEELDFMKMSDDGSYVAVVRGEHSGRAPSTSSFGFRPSYATPVSGNPSSFSASVVDDLMLISTNGSDMDDGTAGTQHILYIGSGSFTGDTTSNPPSMPTYATGRPYLNGGFRRVDGLTFAPDNKSLVFNYRASRNSSSPTNSDRSNPKYDGGTSSFGVNPGGVNNSFFNDLGMQIQIRLTFRDSSNDPINFASLTEVSNNMKNMLQGLSGVGNVGDTTARFGSTTTSRQLFWASFKSPDGSFLYYIVDGYRTNRNYMVGINITGGTINGHAPWVPFSPHSDKIGFEQFDVNSFVMSNRFEASPAGVSFKGRDASGILFVIASDASAGATSFTDLELYVIDLNIGGDLLALTSAVTTGSTNALNYLYASADGNMIAGHRSSAASSRSSRAEITGDNDIFVCTNVHDVLTGVAPNCFILSADASHGASVAFIGEGSSAGPQALVFSRATKGGNSTWDDRLLFIAQLVENAQANAADNTRSHYLVLAGGRVLDDDPFNGN